MDELAYVSHRLLAHLTAAQGVTHGGGTASDICCIVAEGRCLHAVLLKAMAASPRLVNDDLRSFATSVDTMLASLESAIAREARQIH